MRIKNWIEFSKITESNGAEYAKAWKLSKEDIEDYLRDVIDEGYKLTIRFGKKKDDGEFSTGLFPNWRKKILADTAFTPAYRIRIEEQSGVGNEDVTDSIRFATDMIKDEIGADFEIFDEGGNLSLSEISIKGGLLLDLDGEPGEIEGGYIDIVVFENGEAKLTQKQLAEYYSWTDCIAEGDKVYIDIELEDLADLILSKKSNYKELLIKGHEGDIYDNYYTGDYTPDTQHFFDYCLGKENKSLAVKAVIKESGGLEEFKELIKELGNESIEDVNEDELIEYLLKERYYSTLKQLCKDSEIIGEIKSDYADWSRNAHAEKNLQDIYDEFDYIVGKNFSFAKERREVKKHYFTKDSQGNQQRVEYSDYSYFYKIRFSNDWIRETETEYVNEKSLYDIFREYINNSYDFNYELNPHFSDYGDMDEKAFNQEANAMLIRYLGK